MGVAHDVARTLGHALKPVRAGASKLAAGELGSEDTAILKVSSPAFGVGDPLPRAATAEGAGVPPAMSWSGAPEGTRSFAVVVEDPDAPFPKPFVHWLVYGIPSQQTALDAAGLDAVLEGQNSGLKDGFTPAAPPPGHGVHHYHFQVFALDTELSLEAGAGRGALFEAMRGHVVGWGDLVGIYERN